MKKIFTAFAAALLLAGCAQKYDDTGLRDLISGLETRVIALETSVQSIQSAIGDGVFVQKVEEYKDPDTGRTTGITVTYTSGKVVWFQIVPAQNVNDPVLSVIKSGSGELVWAVDGVAIQVNGKEVPVYQTPVFSIDKDGNLVVSIDGGEPQIVGQVQNEGATLQDGIFTNLEVTDKAVVLTLSDGTTVNIPFAEPFQLVIEQTEFIYDKLGTITIPYTVKGATESTVVGVSGYIPMFFSVNVTDTAIEVTPLTKDAQGHILAYADSKTGLTSLVDIDIEPEMAFVSDESYGSYVVDPEGDSVEVPVVSNVEIEAKAIDSWITVVSTKATSYTVTLSMEANPGEDRYGTVEICKKGTETLLQTINIFQPKVVAGPKDLSKQGTANCYIVTEGGDYKFKAVKGNSTESVGAVASAAILWETVNTTTAPAANAIISTVGVEDGYITFSTPDPIMCGNALIAAKDEGGNILWSWHIWIPITDIESSTFGGLFGDALIMDRNLGALEAVADEESEPDMLTYGMYYQWGRKDPFVAPSTGVAGTMTFDAAKMSVEESVKNPTAYIKTGGDSVKDWNTESATDLWGATKTVYDPCPAGYQVPNRDKTTNWWGEKLSKGFVYNTTYKWFKAGVEYDPASPETTGYLVFPVCGYIDQGSLAKLGSRVYIWSAYSSSADLAYQVRGEGGSVYVEEQRKSRAGNVRCVAIAE